MDPITVNILYLVLLNDLQFIILLVHKNLMNYPIYRLPLYNNLSANNKGKAL